jgi:hypothetical protein
MASMGNLLSEVGWLKTKVRIPDWQFILEQALHLSWFRVKRASMGNLLPRLGKSKSKVSIP